MTRPWPSGCITQVEINDDWVSIRSEHYPINSVHPSGARFNAPGDPAYYIASGIQTAFAEKYGDSATSLRDGDAAFGVPSLNYPICDLRPYFQQHPDERARYFAADGDRGYGACRELTEWVQKNYPTCSGIAYPSAALDGGVNVVLWGLSGDPQPEDFFRRSNAFREAPLMD